MEWRLDAACRGTSEERGNFDLFFEEQFERQAKVVCGSCNVRLDCLRWALKENQWDAWVLGGMNPKERERAYRRFLHWSKHRERTEAAWRQWSEVAG